MRRDLKALHAKLRSTIVYVTHDQSEAMTLSDRIAIFSGGRLQQVGTPHDIYNRPVNTFVANFVGDRETNFLDGTLGSEGGRLTFTAKGFTIAFSRPPAGVPAARAVRLGLRPEAIAIVETAGPNTVPAEVLQTELAGPDLFIFARLPDGSEIGCRADPRTPVKEGERVNLLLAEERAHLFDADSGLGISHGTALSDPISH
jgi:ABC-type sugar transport system ATPase subunit